MILHEEIFLKFMNSISCFLISKPSGDFGEQENIGTMKTKRRFIDWIFTIFF
jgi:hypothetical protein